MLFSILILSSLLVNSYRIWFSILIVVSFSYLLFSILSMNFTFHVTKLFSPPSALYSHQWPWVSCCYSTFSILCSQLIFVVSPFSILIFANHWKFNVKSTHLENIELRIDTFAGDISILNSLREIAILDSPFSTNYNCKFSMNNACLIIENWEWNFFLNNVELRMENWGWQFVTFVNNDWYWTACCAFVCYAEINFRHFLFSMCLEITGYG